MTELSFLGELKELIKTNILKLLQQCDAIYFNQTTDLSNKRREGFSHLKLIFNPG